MKSKYDLSHRRNLSGLILNALLLSVGVGAATAQDAGPAGGPPPPGAVATPPPDNVANIRMPAPAGSSAIVASGNYLYLLRGNTLFRLLLSDMATLSRRDVSLPGRTQDLPAPDAGRPAPLDGNAPPPPTVTTPPVPAGPDAPPADPNGLPPPRDASAPSPDQGPASRRPGRQPRRNTPARPLDGRQVLPVVPGGPGIGESALTISGNTLYLLRGNTVYRFRAADLKPLGQSDLLALMADRAGVPPPGGPGAVPPPPGGPGAVPPPPGGPGTPGTDIE